MFSCAFRAFFGLRTFVVSNSDSLCVEVIENSPRIASVTLFMLKNRSEDLMTVCCSAGGFSHGYAAEGAARCVTVHCISAYCYSYNKC